MRNLTTGGRQMTELEYGMMKRISVKGRTRRRPVVVKGKALKKNHQRKESELVGKAKIIDSISGVIL